MEEEKVLCEECGADIQESVSNEIQRELYSHHITLVPYNLNIVFQEKLYYPGKMLCVECAEKKLEKLKETLSNLGYVEAKDTTIPYNKIQGIIEEETLSEESLDIHLVDSIEKLVWEWAKMIRSKE